MTQSPARHYPFLDDPFLEHPYAAIFPLMPDDELQKLAHSIKSDGQLSPLVIYQGKILDGRNRYRAIALINSQLSDGDTPIALKYGTFLNSQSDPQADYLAVKLVENTNLHRRNLTISQRAAIALTIEEFYSQIAKEERKLCLERGKELEPAPSFVNSQKQPIHAAKEDAIVNSQKQPIHAAKEAAFASGVGQQTVSRAKAVKKADPELFQEVLSGDKTVNQAYNQIKPIKPTKPAFIAPIIDDSERLSEDLSGDFIKSCDLITFAHIKLCLAAIAKHHAEALKEWIGDYATKNDSIT